MDAVKPDRCGTKVSALYVINLKAGEEFKVKVKLDNRENCDEVVEDHFSGDNFDDVFKKRISEADEFYSKVLSSKYEIGFFSPYLSNLK